MNLIRRVHTYIHRKALIMEALLKIDHKDGFIDNYFFVNVVGLMNLYLLELSPNTSDVLCMNLENCLRNLPNQLNYELIMQNNAFILSLTRNCIVLKRVK